MTSSWPLPPLLAHRCGGVLAPENTLAGLQACAAAGCAGVEFDVQRSADGTPFLFHDDDLLALTGQPGRVVEASDACLASLRVIAGHRHSPLGEPIPRLAEALDLCGQLGLAVNLELKVDAAGAAALVAAVAACLQERSGPARLVLSSFCDEALCLAAAELPQWPRGLLLERWDPDWLERLNACGASALHLEEGAWTKARVLATRAAGVVPVAWTVNASQRARQLLDWGVCTVISDEPGLLAMPPSAPVLPLTPA